MEQFEAIIAQLSDSQFGLIDAGVIAVIGISAAFAMVRGFFRELLSSACWVVAIIVTVVGYGFAGTVAAGYMPPGIARLVGPVILFIATLAVLMLVAIVVARMVLQPSVGVVDRVLGLGFGAVRGAVLVCIVFMVYVWFVKSAVTRPSDLEELDPMYAELSEAALYPVVERSSDLLFDLLFGSLDAESTRQAVGSTADAVQDAAQRLGEQVSEGSGN